MNRSRTTFTALAICGLAVGASACSGSFIIGTDGSGVAEATTYDFDSFDEIDIGSVFEAEIEIADGPPTVEVTVDDNLVDRLEVKVEDGELSIGLDGGNISFGVDPTVEITLPELTRLELNGASSATVDGLDGGDLKVDLNGASDARFDGRVDDLRLDSNGASAFRFDGRVGTIELEVNGAGNVDLTGADVESVALDANGGSTVEFGSVERVSGELNGASTAVIPDGTEVSVDTSGASNLRRG